MKIHGWISLEMKVILNDLYRNMYSREYTFPSARSAAHVLSSFGNESAVELRCIPLTAQASSPGCVVGFEWNMPAV